jgi:predicted RNA-binding Zn-ribbon protein involved in translation (DUF1610 family)
MTQDIHTCPRCSSTGNVIKHIKIAVKIKCPECEKQWYADSKICPRCNKPNGFAVEGVCSECYSTNHRA